MATLSVSLAMFLLVMILWCARWVLTRRATFSLRYMGSLEELLTALLDTSVQQRQNSGGLLTTMITTRTAVPSTDGQAPCLCSS